MFSESSERGVHAPQQHGSVVWFISFGDLLTLLLCFFIVLTPWSKLGKPANPESQQLDKENVKQSSTFGTPFASKARRVSKIVAEVPVFADGGGSADLARAREELAVINNGTPADVMISLRVCGEVSERQKLVEQLGQMVQGISAGIDGISFEVFGSCEAANLLAPVTDHVVGAVRIVRN